MPRRVTAIMTRRKRPRWIRVLIAVVAVLLLLDFFFGRIIRDAISRHHFRKQPETQLVTIDFGESDAGMGEGYHRFYRYELVPIRVAIRAADGEAVSLPAPRVRVFRSEYHVRDAGRRAEVPLRYDKSASEWEGNWAMPPGCEPGVYTVVCDCRLAAGDLPAEFRLPTAGADRPERKGSRRLELVPSAASEGEGSAARPTDPNQWVSLQVRRDFLVTGREPTRGLEGFGALTWEDIGPDLLSSSMRAPDGSETDWRAIFSWLDYYGADQLWFSGYRTDARFGPLSDGYPWYAPNVAAIDRLGAECHQRGVRFGVYAFAYQMSGPLGLLPYTKGFASDTAEGGRAVPSLLDEQRVSDLAAMVAELDSDPNVDLIGFDYLRDAEPTFDAVDEFVTDLAPDLPPDWSALGEADRQAWLRTEVGKWNKPSPTVWSLWNWWRAHRTAEIVRDIKRMSKCRKPLWAFTLAWQHGLQHGQDPFMLNDAGLDLDAVMLYQLENRAKYEAMIAGTNYDSWRDYSKKGALNLVPGDQVDFFWHQKTLDPPAPAEFNYRITRALRECSQVRAPVGVFCHDLRRTQGDNLGPYSGREWALAGAAAMTEVRSQWHTIPAEVALSIGNRTSVPVGDWANGTVAVHNLTDKPVEIVSVLTFSVPDVESGGDALNTPVSIPPSASVDIPVAWKITGSGAGRAGKLMLAARVYWANQEYFPSATVFGYADAR